MADEKLDRERKAFSAIETKVIDTDLGVVEHLVAVMGNEDLGGDVIHNGAFTKTIVERLGKIRVVNSHNTFSVLDVVGKPLALWEVGREALPIKVLSEYPEATGGLMARTQFLLDTPEGLGVFNRIKSGAVDEYSIGYDALDMDFTAADDGKTIRHLRTVKLWEYSPVVFGMNPATTTVSAKSEGKEEVGEAEVETEPEIEDKADAVDDEKSLDDVVAAVEIITDTKAGRVLAARNEQRLVGALQIILDVLDDAGIVVPGFGGMDEDDEKITVLDVPALVPIANAKGVYENTEGWIKPILSSGKATAPTVDMSVVVLDDELAVEFTEFMQSRTAPADDPQAAIEESEDEQNEQNDDQAGPDDGESNPPTSDDVAQMLRIINAEIEEFDILEV